MGNFITAILLLAALIIFTGVNSFFICRICDEMTSLIENGHFDKAKAVWEEKRSYVAFFVRDAEIDVVSAEMDATSIAIANEDGEAEQSKMSLIAAIGELKHGDMPTLSGIFIIDINA